MIKKTTLDYIESIYKNEKFIKNPTCYIYDLSIIKENIASLQRHAPKQVKLYYAMKANPNNSIMECVKQMEYVKGIEIASSGELKHALHYCKGEQIIFTGPGKTDYELEQAIANRIRFINIESIAEAIRINKIATKLGVESVNVLIRINLNYSVMDGMESLAGCSTKMGIDEDVYVDSFHKISQLEHIQVKGIHVFAASGVLNYKSLIKVDEYIFDLIKRTQIDTGNIEVIDFGGGLGIDYTNNNQEFNVEKYSEELKSIIEKYSLQDKEIIMELGTYIVGNAGYYTSKIIDIKYIKGKKHIIIAGGVNHMGLPLEMRRKHPVHIIATHTPKLYAEQPNVEKEIADISGPLCMVSDKLCWDEYIERAEIGDIVVFRQSGAYCYGEGMQGFLMHMKPEELIIGEV